MADLQATIPERIATIVTRLLASVLIVVVTVYLVWAFNARKMAELGAEHRVVFENEFDASQEESVDWRAYLAIEDRLAEELAEAVDGHGPADSLVHRHDPESWTNPTNLDTNWNRSFEITAASARGVAVLLHGLSDSPYSMRATAETLVEAGFNVVVPRLPGHGFAVGGLRQARWEDWTAAVRIAVRRAMQLGGSDSALIVVGYSNGGLLAIDFALRCEEYELMPCPDGLVLISPAIAISKVAAVTNLHSLVSWTPFFEKFQWLSIRPEIDPFKYTSFPKRAAWEIYQVSTRMHKELADPFEAAKLPPILTFQSIVDNTVDTAAIVRHLYRALPANGSKLVVYDVNRHNTIVAFENNLPSDPTTAFASETASLYDVEILRNRAPDTEAIDLVTVEAGGRQWARAPTGMQWPPEVFSLSHIALPFREDDAVYGNGTGPAALPFSFGTLAPRGESGILLLGGDYFLRTRYNPFYAFQANTLKRWLAERDAAQAP